MWLATSLPQAVKPLTVIKYLQCWTPVLSWEQQANLQPTYIPVENSL